MKVVFMGTPDFAVPCLKALAETDPSTGNSRYEVIAVVTQPDKPRGRSGKPACSPVKETALCYDIPVYQPNIDMKHILLIPPFSLKHDLGIIETENRVITWLMLNPISQNEYAYMQKNGYQKLLDAFVEKNIDIYDLYRKSIF